MKRQVKTPCTISSWPTITLAISDFTRSYPVRNSSARASIESARETDVDKDPFGGWVSRRSGCPARQSRDVGLDSPMYFWFLDPSGWTARCTSGSSMRRAGQPDLLLLPRSVGLDSPTYFFFLDPSGWTARCTSGSSIRRAGQPDLLLVLVVLLALFPDALLGFEQAVGVALLRGLLGGVGHPGGLPLGGAGLRAGRAALEEGLADGPGREHGREH